MTEINWAHIDRARGQGGLDLLFMGPPVLPIGKASEDALEVDGLQEAIDVQEAFSSQGWTLNRGHDFTLNTNFQVGASAAMVNMGFERVNSVYTWAATCAYVNPQPFAALLKSEYEFLSALMQAAENQFPSSVVAFGRGMAFPGVPEEWLPEPFIWVVPEENTVVWDPNRQSLVIQPLAETYRMVVLGYRWRRAPDQDIRTSLITHSVNQLAGTSKILSSLRQQDPSRFVDELANAIPVVDITFNHEVLKSIGIPEIPERKQEPTKLTKSNLESLTKQSGLLSGGSSILSSDLTKGLGQSGGPPLTPTPSSSESSTSGMSVADFRAKMYAKGSQEEDRATIESALSACGVVLVDVPSPTQRNLTWGAAKGNCLIAIILDSEHHHLTVIVMAVMGVPNTEEFLLWILQRPTPPVCRFAVEPETRSGRDIVDVNCVGMLKSEIQLDGVSELIETVYETASDTARTIVDRFGGSFHVGMEQSL